MITGRRDIYLSRKHTRHYELLGSIILLCFNVFKKSPIAKVNCRAIDFFIILRNYVLTICDLNDKVCLPLEIVLQLNEVLLNENVTINFNLCKIIQFYAKRGY